MEGLDMANDTVQFLRDLADWYEVHPLAPPIYGLEGNSHMTAYLFYADEEESKRVLRSLGAFNKVYDGNYFGAEVTVGTRKVTFKFYRNRVCTPKVVGKKMVEKVVVPSSYTPEQIIEAHEEDVIEWDCGSVIAPETPADVTEFMASPQTETMVEVAAPACDANTGQRSDERSEYDGRLIDRLNGSVEKAERS
jgi:hypothetical protein